jgi:beta-hydroxyacyl-ACP dehydratase FabZ
VEPGKLVRAIKNVTFNEAFFQGHFPGQPVMPGVLVLESMAQSAAFLVLSPVSDPSNKLVYFTGIDKARFGRAVTPGDQLTLELKLLKTRLNTFKMVGQAFVDGDLAAEAEMMAMVVDRED